MKKEIGLKAGLLVLVGIAGLGVSPTVHAQTFSGDGDTLESEPIVVRIEEGEAFASAGITVDVAGKDFLGLTATDRKGTARLLDFIPNELTGNWAPAPDDGSTPGVFGADPQLWLFSMLVAGEGSDRIELEPLDRTIADVPHDDVTVVEVPFLFLAYIGGSQIMPSMGVPPSSPA